jgi:hypothetical protein
MYLAEQFVMHVDSELLRDEPGLGTQESKQAALSFYFELATRDKDGRVELTSINNLNCPMEASS